MFLWYKCNFISKNKILSSQTNNNFHTYFPGNKSVEIDQDGVLFWYAMLRALVTRNGVAFRRLRMSRTFDGRGFGCCGWLGRQRHFESMSFTSQIPFTTLISETSLNPILSELYGALKLDCFWKKNSKGRHWKISLKLHICPPINWINNNKSACNVMKYYWMNSNY